MSEDKSRHENSALDSDDDCGDEIVEQELSTRQKILRGTAALPSLVTLGNGIAGFAAIHFATKPLLPSIMAQGADASKQWVAANIVRAAWLILVGMVCDALDGRVARMTCKTSKFGAELDSLCDAITFGVAPAILMLRAVQAELFPFVGELDILPQSTDLVGRSVWFVAAVYACCAILRLARFNVESEDELESHMNFKGLPSPAAALSVISLVLLHSHISEFKEGWFTASWIKHTLMWAMPGFTLVSGLLMVSGVKFPHIVNQLLHGRRSFGYIVTLSILLLGTLVIRLEVILALAAVMFVLMGPSMWLLDRRKKSQGQADAQ